jgi:orotate phosphoribosyltransferase
MTLTETEQRRLAQLMLDTVLPGGIPVAERRLLDCLKTRSFRTGDFTLASGAKSSYYIDVRTTSMSQVGFQRIGDVLAERVIGPDRADAIGGMAVGAVPLVLSVIGCAALYGRPNLRGFWVRPAPKGHGTGQQIEGNLDRRDRVVLVEDVVTSGRSTLTAVDAVRAHGCEVIKVVCLVDRLQGGAEAFARAGVPFEPVFTIRDFGVQEGLPAATTAR